MYTRPLNLEKGELVGCSSGWSDFEETMLHFLCCVKLLWDPDSKIACLHVAFSPVAGPLKILTVTLKWAQQFFYLTFLKVAPEKMCYLPCLKANTAEKLSKNIFPFPFLENQKIFKKFKLYFKNINFLGPCDFLKMKTLPRVGHALLKFRNCLFFGI